VERIKISTGTLETGSTRGGALLKIDVDSGSVGGGGWGYSPLPENMTKLHQKFPYGRSILLTELKQLKIKLDMDLHRISLKNDEPGKFRAW
jgi:hypothetical protein